MENEYPRRKAGAVTDVIIVGEGQTEETFFRDVLAPVLAAESVFLGPRLVPTSPGRRGGALSYPRVLRYLRNTLRQRGDTYVTTFFDLYRLDDAFPGFSESAALQDPLARAALIETRLSEAVIREANCREDRFFAHVQPYEFEALLFTDVVKLVDIEPNWGPFAAQLSAVRAQAESPEHINDGQNTHPSERLRQILQPGYQKTLHGPLAALHIGLTRISEECQHFAQWLGKLRSLKPLA